MLIHINNQGQRAVLNSPVTPAEGLKRLGLITLIATVTVVFGWAITNFFAKKGESQREESTRKATPLDLERARKLANLEKNKAQILDQLNNLYYNLTVTKCVAVAQTEFKNNAAQASYKLLKFAEESYVGLIWDGIESWATADADDFSSYELKQITKQAEAQSNQVSQIGRSQRASNCADKITRLMRQAFLQKAVEQANKNAKNIQSEANALYEKLKSTLCVIPDKDWTRQEWNAYNAERYGQNEGGYQGLQDDIFDTLIEDKNKESELELLKKLVNKLGLYQQGWELQQLFQKRLQGSDTGKTLNSLKDATSTVISFTQKQLKSWGLIDD